MVSPQRALVDTSVFIGVEAGRLSAAAVADYEWAVSAITLGELELGVIRADSPERTARRLTTLRLAQRFDAIQIDDRVAASWALLVAKLRDAGRKVHVNDSWIAATALSCGVPLITQDGDYQHMPDLTVIAI